MCRRRSCTKCTRRMHGDPHQCTLHRRLRCIVVRVHSRSFSPCRRAPSTHTTRRSRSAWRRPQLPWPRAPRATRERPRARRSPSSHTRPTACPPQRLAFLPTCFPWRRSVFLLQRAGLVAKNEWKATRGALARSSLHLLPNWLTELIPNPIFILVVSKSNIIS